MKRQKVERGTRLKQALAFIARRERTRSLWTVTELADELGIAHAQAAATVNALVARGELVRGPRTVVLENALQVAA